MPRFLSHFERTFFNIAQNANNAINVFAALLTLRYPDTSAYNDPEIVFRLKKKNHVGFVIASPDPYRVRYLQDEYTRRIYADFFAKLPPLDKPTS